VDRRRLVDAAGDRLEVGDVEPERPEVAVPADKVERVVAVVVGGDPVARPDLDDELAVLVARLDRVRGVEVALGVRGVLEELAVVVPVALRRLDLRRRLEIEDPLLRALIGTSRQVVPIGRTR
jgi:hypothetical protein